MFVTITRTTLGTLTGDNERKVVVIADFSQLCSHLIVFEVNFGRFLVQKTWASERKKSEQKFEMKSVIGLSQITLMLTRMCLW